MRRSFLSILLIACLIVSALAQQTAPQPTRPQLYRALLVGKALDPDRRIVHLSHACNLRVKDEWLPVVDLQEMVKGAMVPRGVSHIVILNRALKPLHMIEYTDQRPLFCLENRLYLSADLAIHQSWAENLSQQH
jgi:hypothetical protein